MTPAVSLTEGTPYTVSPAPTNAQADADSSPLVDGLYARPQTTAGIVQWAKDQKATIQLALPHTRHVGLIRIHTPDVAEGGLGAIARIRVATPMRRATGARPATPPSGNHFGRRPGGHGQGGGTCAATDTASHS